MSNTFDRRTLVHCLLNWEYHTPDNIWLTQPIGNSQVKTYTWKQAADTVRRLAHYLISLDLPPHSNIVLLGKNSAEWLLADLAIMAAGHVSVPVYYTMNAENLRYVIEHSEARLMIIGKLDGSTDTWPDMKQGVPDALPKITLPFAPPVANAVSLDSIIKNYSPLTNDDLKLPQPEDLATIMYTSGSTGRAKGVMHNQQNMINAAKHGHGVFPLSPDDRILSYLPLAHAAERFIVGTIAPYYGVQVYFTESLDTFLQDLQRARPTIFFSVPRLWVKFQQGINAKLPPKLQNAVFKVPVLSKFAKKFILKKLGLDHVRIAATGSAPLAPDIINWYRKLGLTLQDAYGMTENFAYSHLSRLGQVRTGSVGHACPEVECKISEQGEILVKSPATMLGYYKDLEKTAEAIDKDNFLRTGDMGSIDKDGFLFITGRVKDLFKTSKGKYVAPVPIEQLLSNHPHTESVCVVGSNLNSPVALVMLSEESVAKLQQHASHQQELTSSYDELLTHINQQLEAHEKLAKLVLITERWSIENDLLTPTLKIRRHQIEQHYHTQVPEWESAQTKIVWA
ncbi:AMP-binding protein [Alkanindiges sp. WGS2144]|uniref:AMP-binding protein n=1 Tax=Alkanindiges sp. WGS2144 TaxID=3366808 RepID=UPI0037539D44